VAIFLFSASYGLYGIVAKRVGAPYTAGRHEHWINIKNGNCSRQEAFGWG